MMKMGKVKKFSVSFSQELFKDFEVVSKELGIKNRSRALQSAANLFIAMNRWQFTSGNVAGVILLLYDHEESGLEETLTDVQHDHMDIIVSALHIHVTRKECLLVIAVKGEARKIKMLYEKIANLRGIKQLQYSITPFT